MQRIVPGLAVQFLSPTSPLLRRSSDDRPIVHERIEPESGCGEAREFTPDGETLFLSIQHPGEGGTLREPLSDGARI